MLHYILFGYKSVRGEGKAQRQNCILVYVLDSADKISYFLIVLTGLNICGERRFLGINIFR